MAQSSIPTYVMNVVLGLLIKCHLADEYVLEYFALPLAVQPPCNPQTNCVVAMGASIC